MKRMLIAGLALLVFGAGNASGQMGAGHMTGGADAPPAPREGGAETMPEGGTGHPCQTGGYVYPGGCYATGTGMMGGYGMGPGMMGGYGMGPGMMSRYGMGPGMMSRYGMGPEMMGQYGYTPRYVPPRDVREFLDRTRETRRQLHGLMFDYGEALRDPDTTREELDTLHRRITDLQRKLQEESFMKGR